MGFLDLLRSVFSDSPPPQESRERLAEEWGLRAEENSDEPLIDETDDSAGQPTGYDRRLWTKKLAYLMEEKMPLEGDEWPEFVAEAYALGYDREWVDRQIRSAFEQLVRRMVSDGVVTAAERQKYDAVWRQLGISDEEGEVILRRVVTEAERIFGRPIRKG